MSQPLTRAPRPLLLGVVLVTMSVLVFPTPSAVVAQGGPAVEDFVLLGEERVLVRHDSTITGGDLGANIDAFAGGNPEVRFESNSTANDPASEVFGDRVKLDPGSSIYDVTYNTLAAQPTSVLGTQTTPLALPVVTMPTPLTANPGTTDITVASGGQQSLPSGAYDDLVVSQNATLTLEGGEYHFTTWTLASGATIEADAPVDIRIAGDVTHSGSLTIGPSRASGSPLTLCRSQCWEPAANHQSRSEQPAPSPPSSMHPTDPPGYQEHSPDASSPKTSALNPTPLQHH